MAMEETDVRCSRCSLQGWKVHAALISCQIFFAAFEISCKVSLTDRDSKLVFCLYRTFLASAVLRITAFFVEKKEKAVLNCSSLSIVFVLGLFGVSIYQVCLLLGLECVSPLYASAFRNTIPVFTFLLGALSGMEKANIRKCNGAVKLVACILTLGGLLAIILYKGPSAIQSNITIFSNDYAQNDMVIRIAKFGAIHFKIESWKYGVIFLMLSCLSFSIFLILQASLLEKYDTPVSFASYMCFFGIVQIGLMTLIHDRQHSKWTFISTSKGVAIIYGGLIASGLVFGVQSWVVWKGGALLVAAYQPVETLFTLIFSFIFLKDNIHLGIIIGEVIMLVGVYLFIWVKESEKHVCRVVDVASPNGLYTPQGNSQEIFLQPPLRTHYGPLRAKSKLEESDESFIEMDFVKVTTTHPPAVTDRTPTTLESHSYVPKSRSIYFR